MDPGLRAVPDPARPDPAGEPTGRAARLIALSRITLSAWRAALACFVVAGLTGALFRFQLAHAWDTGLHLGDVRHAHSHLMYFGWVTPALIALVAMRLARRGGAIPRVFGPLLLALFVAALASFPLFLLFGYEPQRLGDVLVPPSVLAASANMLLWYALLGVYLRARRHHPATRATRAWDLAWTFLVMATLGAWGLAIRVPLGLDDPVLGTALTHVFLDLFSGGWFVLGVLGLAWDRLAPDARGTPASLWLVAAGLPFTFALGMPTGTVPGGLRLLAGAGGAAVAVGLAVQVRLLWRHARGERAWLWRIPLALLALGSLAQLVVAAVPAVRWSEMMGLRILYLHVLLLGFVTLGLFASAEETFGRRAAPARPPIHVAIGLLLLSLLPLTSLWPAALGRGWAFEAAAWAALLPVLAVVLALPLPPAVPRWLGNPRRKTR